MHVLLKSLKTNGLKGDYYKMVMVIFKNANLF